MSTGQEHFEKPSGAIDSANRDFTTAHNYQSGTLKLWTSGVLVRTGDDDGFVETGPNSFRTNEAPQGGARPDTLTVRYLEA
jgi:hypothetical protein